MILVQDQEFMVRCELSLNELRVYDVNVNEFVKIQ